jgi:glycosyltransferase involved in cell wall biosynthesis
VTVSLISVILPVYNGARFIAGALDCIEAQRPHCAGHRLELIAVDDASDDGNLSLGQLTAARDAARIDHLVSFATNRGPAAARNAGLGLARGDLVTFLDVDDQWAPTHLARMLRQLANAPDCGFVMSDVQCQLRVQPVPGGVETFEDFGAPGFFPVFSAGLYRREVFERVGLLDEAMRHGEDLDWFLRAREAGVRYVTTSETMLRYRVHETNMSRNRQAAYKGMARALHQSIRRRAAIGARAGEGPV